MKLKAYNYSAFGQSLLDVAIKVGSFCLVMVLNYVISGLSGGSIQLPGGAYGTLIATGLALVLSQLDSKFVAWTQKNNIPTPTA